MRILRFPRPGAYTRPLRVVAFGGGTGLPVLLAGLRDDPASAVTAIVTVGDDGGSSGRLRRELGIAPPGDVRNCLAALAGDRRLADVLDHRFQTGAELRGHALGNLIIAGLVGMSGDFCAGVERAAGLLGVRGAIYPAANSSLTLVLHSVDGATVRGESSTAGLDGSLARVEALPAGVGAPLERSPRSPARTSSSSRPAACSRARSRRCWEAARGRRSLSSPGR